MKKTVKCILMAMSVCALSAFSVVASGCNGLKESINELRCDHVMVDGEVTKEPTCQEEGEMLKECTLCTYTETETLDKLKHAVVILKAVSPTCTKSGLTEGQKCADCEEILVAQKVVAPTGHNIVMDEAVEPTCSTVGKTEGSHCENCDTVFTVQEDIPMLEHVMQEMEAYGATCEEKGFTGGTKCENCDYATEGEIIPALGHSYDDGVVTTEATCDTDGEKTYTCATCEGTKVEVILATGHTFEDGTCSVCGKSSEDVGLVFISGLWLIDENPNVYAETLNENVTITLGTGITINQIQIQIYGVYFKYDGKSGYSVEHGWDDEGYRYWDFGNGQYVSKQLKGWIVANGEVCSREINFTIGGTTYQAVEGMTWGKWVDSEYNTCSAVMSDDYILIGDHTISGASPSMEIVKDKNYTTYHEK